MSTISHSQDDGFIAKLTDILSVNLENENFGVRELASSIGLSRSQLHRKLHAIKGESASQFIREYRLQKALELLKSNLYTAAEVAYKVGFASPTYFNTCFNDYFGYSPGKVKDKSFIGVQEKDLEEGSITTNKPWAAFIGPKVYRFRLTIISILIIVTIGVLLFFYNLNSNRNNLLNGTIREEAKTIAIIPFKNLSEEIENQYYADGIMASI
ncbi:helix-turn-helix domain-containing protein [Arenibacter latericius]|uniref:helix-turn-helix domain-containing protein n=1 Tax=Arenibacter latericius TaxID=86104 RepID=UPI0003FFE38E|nr:AraC family transcriptional regulator [Arenibacter latericius]